MFQPLTGRLEGLGIITDHEGGLSTPSNKFFEYKLKCVCRQIFAQCEVNTPSCCTCEDGYVDFFGFDLLSCFLSVMSRFVEERTCEIHSCCGERFSKFCPELRQITRGWWFQSLDSVLFAHIALMYEALD